MKTIRLSVKKLNAAADSYFDSVSYHESNPHLPVTKDYLEQSTLAGIALRKWAVELKESRKAARSNKTDHQ